MSPKLGRDSVRLGVPLFQFLLYAGYVVLVVYQGVIADFLVRHFRGGTQ
jgi:hypothetical protein